MNKLYRGRVMGAITVVLILSACGGGGDVAEAGVPGDADAVENPVEATADSLAAGQSLFDRNCAVCHGREGKGDGPGAQGLRQPPSDLTAAATQDRTDGALFRIISEGIRGSAMPPWEAQLSQEDRWHIVNYLRSLG